MKIAICDDEHVWREVIESSITKWAEIKKLEIQCARFSTSHGLSKFLAKERDIDILFLDITLGAEEVDGMALAKTIRTTGNTVPIIFVTANSHRAADGYLVDAMGFLSKPIEEKRLFLFLDKIVKNQSNDKTVKIPYDGRVKSIYLRDICYVDVVDHVATYHTMCESYSFRSTLTDVMAALDNAQFMQIHRSYIIALDKIHSVKMTYPYSVDIQLGNEITNLAVSRKYIRKLQEVFSDDVMEMMI